MKRLVIATMLAAFSAAIALPVLVASSDGAVAAEKKKSMEKSKKKKPTGKM